MHPFSRCGNGSSESRGNLSEVAVPVRGRTRAQAQVSFAPTFVFSAAAHAASTNKQLLASEGQRGSLKLGKDLMLSKSR